jgi:DnaK suppressor protein
MATAKKKPAAKAKAKPKSAIAKQENSNSLHGLAPYKVKAKEEYMNENQREHFKQILCAWRNELMEEVDRTVSHMKDEAANFPDPADRATQEEEFSLELRTRDRERKLIKKIDKTLVRVEEDDYGFCDQCGVEIGIRRLEARPTAELCVDCKTLDEIKEKQITGG